ncbi:hybrid sensor histidine kinase/response regulator [Laspinema olomoucense]|uniref:hybrid sensor histidine kinase/response regulator n=1 Tax=Laspinema olomoucense TaxID=3231600 RepID=UPI0021BB8E48|nr:hybrid sensor histidine kinase/response regulator [Laspinema sp. D3a]MCT7989703.1 hybrid sensor histidine kinase/response regulator [Laspinema sp. D3a]
MNKDEVDLSHLSMLDLFGMEVETQAALLNENLLGLENHTQSGKELEALMRGAHSIKGAARIVQLDEAVHIAHVMEDYFVAAREGRITVSQDHIDILLSGVDLLLSMGKVQELELKGWMQQHQREIDLIASQIKAIASPGTAQDPPQAHPEPSTLGDRPAIPSPAPKLNLNPVEPPPTPLLVPFPEPPEPIRVQSPPSSRSSGDRVVRLSADNLNRLMGLAGESLIEANWLQPFADSLLKLKKHQTQLSKTLEKLGSSLSEHQTTPTTKNYLETAQIQDKECLEILNNRLEELELFARRFANLSDRLYREVIDSHMRPFSEGVSGFPRMMRDLAKQLGKSVKFEIMGKATKVDRDILEKLEAPLTQILRNAIAHGIESPSERIAAGKPAEGTVRLEAVHRGGMLLIIISDDGRGINLAEVRQQVIANQLVNPEFAHQLTETELMEFLFLPSFSTVTEVTEISGRGVGLDIAKGMMQEVGGLLRAQSELGKGTRFHLQLPLTLSVIRTLLVEISGEPYGFPLTRIDRIVQIHRGDIFVVENRQYFTLNGQNISLVSAHQVLELGKSELNNDLLSVIVLSDRTSYYGLVVERFLGERDLVVRPLDPRLGKVRDISAAALMEDGSPVLIIDVEDLVRSLDLLLSSGRLSQITQDTQVKESKHHRKILVVDDSITVREMERKLLQNKGYNVDVAVNGVDAWNAARAGEYDLIITDVDMPRMNGIELVKYLKNHAKLKSTPVIIVSYKDREEDRLLGLEAGANYYLTKSSFHDDTFLNAVIDMIGTPDEI